MKDLLSFLQRLRGSPPGLPVLPADSEGRKPPTYGRLLQRAYLGSAAIVVAAGDWFTLGDTRTVVILASFGALQIPGVLAFHAGFHSLRRAMRKALKDSAYIPLAKAIHNELLIDRPPQNSAKKQAQVDIEFDATMGQMKTEMVAKASLKEQRKAERTKRTADLLILKEPPPTSDSSTRAS